MSRGAARWPGRQALTGIALWLLGFVLLPAPLAARILLLAPLVIVPRLFGALPPRPVLGRAGLATLSGWPALAAALPLLAAFALPPGPVSALLAAPWLALAAAAAVAALRHGLPRLPALLHPRYAADLAVDAALGYLAVGALFLATDRLGVRPLGFSTAIILLTAVHFHFAGFALTALAALASARGDVLARVAALGFVTGMPLTAAGFALPSPVSSWLGSLVVAGSGFAMAAVFLRLGLARGSAARPSPARAAALALAGIALLAAMPLAVGWATAVFLGASFLDLETMVRTHGSLNGAAVLFAGLAWSDERAG